MINDIVALVRVRIAASVRRTAAPAAFALIAAIFALFGVAGLFAALFFWLAPVQGLVGAALICAAVALVVALLATLPFLFKRQKPPPPQPDAILPQVLTLMAQSAPRLRPRQLLLTAAVIGVALALTARGGDKKPQNTRSDL